MTFKRGSSDTKEKKQSKKFVEIVQVRSEGGD